MTKKWLLNTTSTKKRDTMLCSTNVTASNPTGSGTYTAAPAILTGATYEYILPFQLSNRDLTSALGVKGVVSDVAARTSTTCFMRGYKECITIQTTDGLPWLWRRIVFTTKGPLFLTSPTGFTLYQETSNGFGRVVNAAPAGSVDAFISTAFRGTRNVDWNDLMDAPIDTSRVTLLYDKCIKLASGNEDGMIKKFNFWHPFNKNLVYDDDENGGSEFQAGNGFSTRSKAGMGDIYVVDYIRPRMGGTTSSQLSFHPQATLYWHEK